MSDDVGWRGLFFGPFSLRDRSFANRPFSQQKPCHGLKFARGQANQSRQLEVHAVTERVQYLAAKKVIGRSHILNSRPVIPGVIEFKDRCNRESIVNCLFTPPLFLKLADVRLRHPGRIFRQFTDVAKQRFVSRIQS